MFSGLFLAKDCPVVGIKWLATIGLLDRLDKIVMFQSRSWD